MICLHGAFCACIITVSLWRQMFVELHVACFASLIKCSWRLPTGLTSNSLGERNDSQSIIHDASATVVFWTLGISVSLLLAKINMTWFDFILLLHVIFSFFFCCLFLSLFHLCRCGRRFTLHYANCSFTKLTLWSLASMQSFWLKFPMWNKEFAFQLKKTESVLVFSVFPITMVS